jgi:hypothetical protein
VRNPPVMNNPVRSTSGQLHAYTLHVWPPSTPSEANNFAPDHRRRQPALFVNAQTTLGRVPARAAPARLAEWVPRLWSASTECCDPGSGSRSRARGSSPRWQDPSAAAALRSRTMRASKEQGGTVVSLSRPPRFERQSRRRGTTRERSERGGNSEDRVVRQSERDEESSAEQRSAVAADARQAATARSPSCGMKPAGLPA